MSAGRYIGYVAQFVAGVLIGTMPIWIADFLSENSRYRYLLSFEPVTLCFIGAGLAVILAPQLLRLAQVVLRNLTALLFHAAYATRRSRYAPLALSLAAAVALALGVSNLLQGASVLGYSLAREIKHASNINRQHLVMQANAEEEARGVGASYQTLRKIVTLYPDDYRNDAITAHLANLESAQELSRQVQVFATQYRDSGNLIMAAESYQAALQIWPHNREARTELQKLETAAANARDSIRQLHAGCANLESPGRATIAATAPFVLREPRAVLEHLEGGGTLANAAVFLACEGARAAATGYDFVEDVLSRFSTRIGEEEAS